MRAGQRLANLLTVERARALDGILGQVERIVAKRSKRERLLLAISLESFDEGLGLRFVLVEAVEKGDAIEQSRYHLKITGNALVVVCDDWEGQLKAAIGAIEGGGFGDRIACIEHDLGICAA